MTTYHPKQKTLREKKKAVKRWLLSTTCRALLIVLVTVFGVMYLMQTSSVSTKGYEISDLEGQLRGLEEENQRLEFKIATQRSMKSIQQRLQGTELVAANDVEYVTLVGTAVALR